MQSGVVSAYVDRKEEDNVLFGGGDLVKHDFDLKPLLLKI